MTLWEKITEVYPDLTSEDFGPRGTIVLRDDSDGQGAYIEKWEHALPLPKSFKVGK